MRVLVFILLCSNLAYAEQINIGISFSIPPYVIKEDNSGIELDILREAFAVRGHTVVPQYVPLARAFKQFDAGIIDGVINVLPGMVGGHFSDIVIVFDNQAISLKKNKYSINKIRDLANFRVTAFQRASVILGKEFGDMANNSSQYREVAAQIIQINLLFLARTDVVVMDRRIFNYYRKQAYADPASPAFLRDNIKQEVTFHSLFPPSKYRFAFSSEKTRDDFNYGVKVIKENGKLAAITEKYGQLMALPSGHSPLPQELQ